MLKADSQIINAPWLSFSAWPRQEDEEFDQYLTQLLDALPKTAKRNRIETYRVPAIVLLSNILAPTSEIYRYKRSSSHNLNDGEIDNPVRVTVTGLVKVIDAAISLGWLEPIDYKKVIQIVKRKAASRFVVTDECPRLTDPSVIGFHPDTDFVFCKRNPLFEGFEAEGLIDYPEHEVEEDRRLLAEFNNLILDTRIELDGRLLPHSRPLRRLVKLDEDNPRHLRNGRFFGGVWQTIRRVNRSRMLINGNRTVELDFSGMFLRALYHDHRVDYQGDPYQLGELDRSLWKAIVQISLNVRRRGCHKALRNLLDKDFSDNDELRPQIERLKSGSKPFFDILKDHHGPIRNDLFKPEIGALLMWRESQVAKRIIQWGAAHRIPVLSLHDGFIVEEEQEENLFHSMQMSYRDEFGFNPVIDKK